MEFYHQEMASRQYSTCISSMQVSESFELGFTSEHKLIYLQMGRSLCLYKIQ